MKVIQALDGKWLVIGSDGNVISEHTSNASAWRALDRLENEPINKREAASDWSFRQQSGGD